MSIVFLAHDALKSVTKAASTPTKNGIKDMKGNAQKKGFQLQSDNPGRGNCMFFALLDQVARLGIQGFTEPQPLREELVDFLKQNPTLVSDRCWLGWKEGEEQLL